MINVGIVGYGNLGKACERVVMNQNDMQLKAIFSRRKTQSVYGTIVVDINDISNYKNKIDIMLLCGGSATDLTNQSDEIIKIFNTADSFDTHARMTEHFDSMDKLGKKYGHVALIATGWDPGLFSTMRVLFESILPEGDTYTFWGKGVSQGHSEAIRKIEGVKYGIQYTVPKKEAVDSIKMGNRPVLSTRDKHERVCYVVANDDADKDKIKEIIVNMPNYFADYDTTVNFISEEEFLKNHNTMPHGGEVLRCGSANDKTMNIDFSINLQSNPDFTAGVLVAYARAAIRMKNEGRTGAVTVFDIPVAYLTQKTSKQIIKELL